MGQTLVWWWVGVSLNWDIVFPFVMSQRGVFRPGFATANLTTLPVAGLPDALEQSLDPGQTEWERSRERDEFARASILYRPSSSSLSSRFTRAQHGDDDDRVGRSQEQEVGHRQAGTSISRLRLVRHLELVPKKTSKLKSKWFRPVRRTQSALFVWQDDKESSSKDKTTSGKPSRETLEWHPDKLLCKRFNVPDPFPG